MKTVSALLLLATVAVSLAANAPQPLPCGKGPNHSLLLGSRATGDSEVYDGALSASTTRGTIQKNVNWRSGNEKITRIEVVDQKNDGTGGCAQVTAGGVGQKFVKLHFTTPQNGAFDFKIKIYAKP